MFGESVVYYPDGDEGAGRTISARLERNVEVIGQGGDMMVFRTVVSVLDSSTVGISATEIDTHRDKVGLAMRIGESPKIRQIVRVQSTENGIVRFEVN